MFSALVAAISSALLASYGTFLLMIYRQEKSAKNPGFSRATIFEEDDDESFLRIFNASKFHVTFSDEDSFSKRRVFIRDDDEKIICEYADSGLNMTIFNGYIILSGRSPHTKILKKSYENTFSLASPYRDDDHTVTILQ